MVTVSWRCDCAYYGTKRLHWQTDYEMGVVLPLKSIDVPTNLYLVQHTVGRQQYMHYCFTKWNVVGIVLALSAAIPQVLRTTHWACGSFRWSILMAMVKIAEDTTNHLELGHHLKQNAPFLLGDVPHHSFEQTNVENLNGCVCSFE